MSVSGRFTRSDVSGHPKSKEKFCKRLSLAIEPKDFTGMSFGQ
jgi:hypothetical protein